MERRSRLGARAVASAAAALLAIAVAGAPAAARTELFTIEIDLDEGGVQERFSASSPLLCDAGDVFTDFHFGAGNFNAAGSFHLDKLLVCDDGSGWFVIRLDAGTNFVTGGGTQGGWSVVPGSGGGDYAGLKGGGSIVGIPNDEPPIDLVDHYFGRLGR